MTTPTLIEPAAGIATLGAPGPRCAVLIEDQACIPGWVNDLDTFRRWTRSDGFPAHGLFAFLQGDIWVDLTMEEFLSHNQVKWAITGAIFVVLKETNAGRFAPDRMRWANTDIGLSTDPDGLFGSWATWQSGRLRLVKGVQGGIMELEGTPDMALEIISASSVNKDTVRLRDLYWRAGVTEYWLVDARGETPKFEILRHAPDGYTSVQPQGGWLASAVFGQAFRLTRQSDPLGNPMYTLETRAGAPAA